MKISIDGIELFEITELQKKVICNDICIDQLDDDLKRRLEYIIFHKYDQCLKRLKEQWMPILAQRYESIPTSDNAVAQLILSQPDYKCRKMRDEDNAACEN